jgi:D-alanyl-D-alanine dipeptidase
MFRAVLFCLLIVFLSCAQKVEEFNDVKKTEIKFPLKKEIIKLRDTCALERLFVQKKLVNIRSLDSSIRVVLHYSTAHNFLNKALYNGLTDCYLPCEVAIKLCNAQQFLHAQAPNYHLIIFDATRPLHIQKQMWDELDLPPSKKINYLAHPTDISLHNYGAAVDVGIIGENGLLLDMGTPFDFFGELSEPRREKEFLYTGKLSKEALANRILLRRVMMKAHFTPITSEWWHFNATNKVTAALRYDLIN